MNGFLTSSIGKKFLMSITGLFLISFLCVHLTVNLLILFGSEKFNIAANFMGTNPVMKIIEPVLALGFILHIIYATYLTLENQKARPVKYQIVNQSESSSWSSRNMYILGGLIFIFLVLHIANFFWKIKFGHVSETEIAGGLKVEDTYTLVASLLCQWWYAVIYIIGAIFLGLHLSHAFWAAFQTLGWSGTLWRNRLAIVGNIFAIIIAFGFSIIPIFLIIKNL
jgi:succinate dehydrogenase / fumarate reductase cytochrome b subunit